MARLNKIKLSDGTVYDLGEDISTLVQRIETLESKVAALENP